jgi:hypothetical protein
MKRMSIILDTQMTMKILLEIVKYWTKQNKLI